MLTSTGIGCSPARPVATAAAGSTRAASYVLRGAVVFDGTGAPPRELDVAVDGDRIAAVGTNLDATGDAIDLDGLALAPGFIDIHGHTDQALLIDPRAESKLRQGVTTEVIGQDGSSIGPWTDERLAELVAGMRAHLGTDEPPFRDLAGFFDWLDRRGAALNVASMIGHGTIRQFVVGMEDRPATAEELDRMAHEVQRAIESGACGLSSGLEYTPGGFGSTEELIRLAYVLHDTGLPYASHMRNEDDEVFAALEEAIRIGRMAGVRVEVSHLKAQGARNWWKAPVLLEMIERASGDGITNPPDNAITEEAPAVGFDVYPYVAYSTGLSSLFPISARDGGSRAFLRRLRNSDRRAGFRADVLDKIDQIGGWNHVQISGTSSQDLSWAKGRRLGDLAIERGEEPFDLLVHLLVEDDGRTDMVGFGMSEENVEMQLAHPLSVVCSDGGARSTEGPLSEDVPHPRTFGAFPRVLGRYVRERGILPMETAIHKMTQAPARRIGVHDRGVIRPGAFADLVAFDPSSVSDRATFENPHQYPSGIPHIWVNGAQVLRDGAQTGALPGRGVRPGQ